MTSSKFLEQQQQQKIQQESWKILARHKDFHNEKVRNVAIISGTAGVVIGVLLAKFLWRQR